jgi:AraC-like DNA-binding protein
MKVDGESLMTIPFGYSAEQTRSGRRYDWDNADRGSEAFVIFQFTIRGQGVFSLGGREYLVPAGHAFIAVVPEVSRYYRRDSDNEWVFSWINFYGEFSTRLWSGLRERTGPVFALAPSFLRILEQVIVKARARAWRDSYEASEEAYRFYLEVLRHLRLPKRRAPKRLAQSIAHLRTNYQEALRMKEVAAQAGMSREHFTRLFLQQTGKSPAAFLREIRLKAAARLVRTTNLPISEIAFRCGFTSATKLGIFFKREHGIPAAAFRRRLGAGT